MSDDPKQIKCAACNVPIKVRTESGIEIGFCPVCGISEKLEDARRDAAEFQLETMQKQVQSIMKDAFTSAKGFEFSEGFVPQRKHRFIADTE